jgi:hypothetical protein
MMENYRESLHTFPGTNIAKLLRSRDQNCSSSL